MCLAFDPFFSLTNQRGMSRNLHMHTRNTVREKLKIKNKQASYIVKSVTEYVHIDVKSARSEHSQLKD